MNGRSYFVAVPVLTLFALALAGAEKSKEKVVKIGAVELMKEFQTDQAKAEAKYKKKVLLVDGVITEVNPKVDVLTMKGTEFTDVACDFSPVHRAKLSKLKKGDKVKVRGTFTEVVATGNALLMKCEIAD